MAEISKIIRKQQSKMVDTLARKSHFNAAEVDGLLGLYRQGQIYSMKRMMANFIYCSVMKAIVFTKYVHPSVKTHLTQAHK
jgi:nitrogen regulatory protein PII